MHVCETLFVFYRYCHPPLQRREGLVVAWALQLHRRHLRPSEETGEYSTEQSICTAFFQPKISLNYETFQGLTDIEGETVCVDTPTVKDLKWFFSKLKLFLSKKL